MWRIRKPLRYSHWLQLQIQDKGQDSCTDCTIFIPMHSVECCLRAFFGSIGIWTASRPFSIALGTTLGLLTLGLGLLTLQVENDVANMWISQRGRINSERAFYEANFELKSPQVKLEPHYCTSVMKGIYRIVLPSKYDVCKWCSVPGECIHH